MTPRHTPFILRGVRRHWAIGVEVFVLRLFRAFSFFLLISIPVFGASRKKALPAAKELNSTLASATEAFGKSYFSEKEFTVPEELRDAMESGVDLNLEEEKKMRAFCSDTSVPAEKKTLYVARYGIGQKELTDVMIFCKEQGIKVQLTTDLNRALTVVLKEGEKYTFDFKGMAFSTEENGRLQNMAAAIKALIDAGFSYNDPKWGIYSQPLYAADDDSIKPIMHEKAVIGWIDDQSAESWLSLSTANWAQGNRVNRLFFLNDPLITKIYQEHLVKMNQAFVAEKSIADGSATETLRYKVNYADGSHIDIAFTGGQFNPNDRIKDLYDNALNGDFAIEEVYFSEFVFTNVSVFESMAKYLKQDEATKIFGIFEDRFIDIDGWGLAGALAGFDIYRPFGRMVFGLGTKLVNRMELYGYQREARAPDGELIVEKDDQGPPTSRYLWHDKTHVAKVRKDDKVYYVIHTGSFNLSNHVENSEVQLEIWVPEDSKFGQAMVASIKDTPAAQPEWALPLKLAVARNAIGKITAHSDLEVPVANIEAVIAAVHASDDKALVDALKAIQVLPSALIKRPAPEVIDARIEKVQKFLEWYRNLNLPEISENYIARKFVGLSVLLTREKIGDYQAKRIIKALLWRPAKDADEQKKQEEESETQAIEALKIFGIDASGVERASKFNDSVEEGAKQEAALRPTKASAIKNVPDYYNFDWDDNILNMASVNIILFDKRSGEELEVSTADFGKIPKNDIGRAGTPWANYRIVNDRETGSFRNFGTAEGPNKLLEQLKFTLQNESPLIWKGKSFRAFVAALQDKERAKRVSIVTARPSSAKHFIEALKYLQGYLLAVDGIQIYLPPAENIGAVGAYKPEVPTEVKKWDFLEQRLKVIQNEAEANGSEARWGFSDDDPTNLLQVREEIMKLRQANPKALSRVKQVLFYTGKTDPRIKLDIEVFDPGAIAGRAPKPRVSEAAAAVKAPASPATAVTCETASAPVVKTESDDTPPPPAPDQAA